MITKVYFSFLYLTHNLQKFDEVLAFKHVTIYDNSQKTAFNHVDMYIKIN